MKKNHLQEIARLSKTSVPTVSKVLNHCSGVDSETRERVFRAADEIAAPEDAPAARCDIYFITPENPAFFWKDRAYSVLRADSRFRCKHNVYTFLHDSESCCYLPRYLEEAKRLRARAVVAVCMPAEEERRLLASLAEDALVILLSEYAEVRNAFYVGSDPERDGFRLGRLYAERSRGRSVILTRAQNENCCARVKGFLAGAGARNAVTVELPPYNKLFPAKTAALLSALPAAEEYAVYSAAGLMDEVVLAARKAGIFPKSVFFGHDLRRYVPGCRIAATIEQRVEEQAATAVRLAEEYLTTGLYPAQKRTLIPSRLEVYPAEG